MLHTASDIFQPSFHFTFGHGNNFWLMSQVLLGISFQVRDVMLTYLVGRWSSARTTNAPTH